MLLMILGTVGAIGDGMSTNCLLVFASRLMNSLGYGKGQKNQGNFMTEVEKVSSQLSHHSCFSLSLYLTCTLLLTVQFILCILGISSHGGGFYG